MDTSAAVALYRRLLPRIVYLEYMSYVIIVDISVDYFTAVVDYIIVDARFI
jgi:hypothetical protein